MLEPFLLFCCCSVDGEEVVLVRSGRVLIRLAPYLDRNEYDQNISIHINIQVYLLRRCFANHFFMQLALFYPFIHKVLKPTFPDCLWTGNSTSATIALTFDDGPHPHHTSRLLEVLDRYEIPASFFWLGACVDRSPEMAQAIWQRGHWIGLHGYDHRSFPRLSVSELRQSLETTQMAIAKACQLDLSYVQRYIRDVRPPNGLFTPQTLRYLQQWNYRPVMWSVVPEDWVRPGIDTVLQRVLQQTCNGALIVLHDGLCGGEDVAETADRLIPHLLNQGYEFVTVDQLWQQQMACRTTNSTHEEIS